jgi:hypothetical protein
MDPFTGALILGGLNAGMGALKAQQQAKQRQAEASMRAAEIEASPWTGKGPSTQVATAAPSAWAEMAGGAVNALGQTAALQNAGLFKASDVAAPQITPPPGEAVSMVMPQKKSIWDSMRNLSKTGIETQVG